MGWVFLIGIIVLIVIIFKGSNTGGKADVQHRTSKKYSNDGVASRKPIKPYKGKKVSLDVKGIFAENSRIRLFRQIEIGDRVKLEFEGNNEYDKNAIGVYTLNGRMLGYLPRNRRKVIKTLRLNPNAIALVGQKGDLDGYIRKNTYDVSIDCYLGYSADNLKEVDKLITLKKKCILLKSDIKQEISKINKEYSSLKKTNPEMLFEKIRVVSERALILNDLASDFTKMHKEYPEVYPLYEKNYFEVRPPLDKLTIVAKALGKYEFIIQFIHEIEDKPHLQTERQMKNIMKRYEWAKNNIQEEE